MLVLTRKTGEEIHIGEGIVVTVLAQEGGRVRLGITAPAEVPIRRAELPPRLTVHWPDRKLSRSRCTGT